MRHAASFVDPLEVRTLFSTVAPSPPLSPVPSATPIVLPPVPSSTLAAFGPLDADKLADQTIVRRTNVPNQIEIQLSTGTGTGDFTKSDTVRINSIRPIDVAVADANRDGKGDVVILGSLVPPPLNPTSPVVFAFVLLGDGAGHVVRSSTTQAPLVQRVGIPRLTTASSLAVADFDADGLTDFAALGKVVQPTSTGVLTRTAIVVTWGVPPLLPVILPPTVITPIGNPLIDSLFSGDVDGDKKADLVAVRRHAVPTSYPVIATSGGVVTAIAPRPDLVTVRFLSNDRQSPTVTVGLNPLYLGSPSIPLPTLAVPVRDLATFGLADLDGNGTAELVGRRGQTLLQSSFPAVTPVAVIPTFRPATPIPSQGNVPPLTFSQTLIADINGDTRPDLRSDTLIGRFVAFNRPDGTNKPTFHWARTPSLPGTTTILVASPPKG